MRELREVDLKRAKLVPSSVFSSPDEVVQARAFSVPQKLAILRRWEFDARRVARFSEDPMLEQIRGALRMLGSPRPELPVKAAGPFRDVTTHSSEATPHEAILEPGERFKL